MKRQSLLLFGLLLLATPAAVQAQFSYTVTNTTITITGYTGTNDVVAIPSTINGLPVTAIGHEAFYNSSVTSVIIPASVTSIGDYAFYYCSGLTSVTIPNSVTTVGSRAFSYCYSLTNIMVHPLNPAFSSVEGVLFNHTQTTLVAYPDGKVEGYTIPGSVTSIGDAAFAGCSSLTSVALANSVTSIGAGAFENCGSLTDVTIGNSVTSIGDSAFSAIGKFRYHYGCPLVNVTIGNSVTNIGNWTFAGCDGLTNVTIPNSVTTVGRGAFSYCSSLTDIMVDPLNPAFSSVEGVLFNHSQTALVEYPAGKCGDGYTIPGSVTSIGDSAFAGCSGLTSVTIANSVTTIGDSAFEHCYGLTSMTIPNSVTSIGAGAFFDCSSLTSVTIPNSVTSLGGSAFFDCSSLTDVTLGDGVTTIGERAFAGTSLTSVTIPNSVTSIGDSAFVGCWFTDITIPNSITTIGDHPFAYCYNLTNITVGPLNPAFSSVDGVLFNHSQTTLVEYPGGKVGAYTIPSSVTSIGKGAFWGCSSLTSITIPNSVTGIPDSAFQECSSLTSITIPNSVTSIGDYAFDSCSLTNVTLGSGVVSIGAGAFFDCVGLTSLTIPNSVTYIGDLAFAQCHSLTSLYFQGNAPGLGGINVFLDDNPTIYYIYYLPGSVGWSSTFGGRPTALWRLPYPLILTSSPGFGVRTNQFGFTVSWATNLSVVVEAATDLANPIWSPLQTNTLTSGWFYFSDRQWKNYPARFYRIRSQ